MITRLDEFPDPLSWFKIWEGGLSLLGGIAGALALVVPYPAAQQGRPAPQPRQPRARDGAGDLRRARRRPHHRRAPRRGHRLLPRLALHGQLRRELGAAAARALQRPDGAGLLRHRGPPDRALRLPRGRAHLRADRVAGAQAAVGRLLGHGVRAGLRAVPVRLRLRAGGRQGSRGHVHRDAADLDRGDRRRGRLGARRQALGAHPVGVEPAGLRPPLEAAAGGPRRGAGARIRRTSSRTRSTTSSRRRRPRSPRRPSKTPPAEDEPDRSAREPA